MESEPATDKRLFGTGNPVVPGVVAERSDIGGEGGVGASDTVDEVDFVGGVAIVGEEVVVAGDASDIGDPGRP